MSWNSWWGRALTDRPKRLWLAVGLAAAAIVLGLANIFWYFGTFH
ncbi:hypothetical protein [Xiamenia xianingshaonis]|nr:hypothetical protein [Xiamenia xianingshaonis]